MIRLALVFLFFSFAQIFDGDDSRRDISGLTGRQRASANAVLTLVNKNGLFDETDKGFGIESSALRYEPGVCPDEPFANERASWASMCSAVLISPDTILSAGHCVKTIQECKDFIYVTGYSQDRLANGFPADSRYECKKLLDWGLNELEDFSVIRLNRPVKGVVPLRWRREGKLEKGDRLYTIGSPLGLPLKKSDGVVEFVSNDAAGVSTTIDSFEGNSGGPVLNPKSSLLEGILVGGEPAPTLFMDRRSGCLRWSRATPVRTDRYRPYGNENEIVTRTRVVPVSDLIKVLERFGSYGLQTSPQESEALE